MRRRHRAMGLAFERSESRTLLAADGLGEIVLSAASVAENRPAGTVVGGFSVGDVAGVSFSLVAGDGGADNARFRIVGDQLRTATMFDYEARRSFSVRVRAADATGVSVEQPFTIGVSDVNDAPTGIRLTRAQVEAGRPAGTLVGNLETIDQDAVAVVQIIPLPAIFRYELVAGPGDRHNASFTIARDIEAGVDQLRTAAPLPAGTYSIRVRSTDTGGLSVERILAVRAAVVNRPPEAVTLAGEVAGLDEGVVGPRPVKVADIVVTDDGQGTNTIKLGGADAARFMVLAGGLHLRPGTRLDFETKPALEVTVLVQDLRLPASPAVSALYSLAVRDVDERPMIRPQAMLVGGVPNTPFALDFTALATALQAVDPEGRPLAFVVQGVPGGSLQRLVTSVAPDGSETAAWVAVTADAPVGLRTITAADQFRWEPPATARGMRPALRLRATDGVNESLQVATVAVAIG